MSSRRDITRTDETVGRVTIRRYHEAGTFIGAAVYNASGFKVGNYKTERGAVAAANRLNSQEQ